MKEDMISQEKEFTEALVKVEEKFAQDAGEVKKKNILEVLHVATHTNDLKERKRNLYQAAEQVRAGGKNEADQIFSFIREKGNGIDPMEKADMLVIAANQSANFERVRSEALLDLVSRPVPKDLSPGEFRSLQDQFKAQSETPEKNAAIVTYEALVAATKGDQIFDDTMRILQAQQNNMVRKEVVYRLLNININYAEKLYGQNKNIWEEVFGAGSHPQIQNGKYYVVIGNWDVD